MLLACFLPLLPAVTSKETFCPSVSVLNPGMLIAEKCAKRSSPPSVGVMKPKPLESLNHFTVPVAITDFLQLTAATRSGRDEAGHDDPREGIELHLLNCAAGVR